MAWLAVSRTRGTKMCEAAQATGITVCTTIMIWLSGYMLVVFHVVE